MTSCHCRLNDINIFQQVLKHPEYKKYPTSTIQEHLNKRLIVEQQYMDTDWIWISSTSGNLMFMTFAENTMGKPYGHKHHHIFRDLCENQFGFQTFTMFHGWWLPGLMIDWGYYITVQTFTLKDAGVFGFFYHGKVTKLGVMEICIKSNFRLFFFKSDVIS